MTTRRTGTRQEWLKERIALLEAEKDMARRGDELARRRQALPWVRVDKDYRFETDAGRATLAELFQGRSQLLVYHFMFGPDFKAGCPSCSAIADGFNGITVHLANHDVMLWAVSRGPLVKLQDYKKRMGWSFPWASSADSSFNFDFSVSFTEEELHAGMTYNFEREPARDWRNVQGGEAELAATCGIETSSYHRERPGLSAFVIDDGVIYHTYSTYSRGVDGIWSMYAWLDRAPKGRNETDVWWRRNDEYVGA